MHTWLSTQAEGWWRLEFDRLKIPYDLHQHADGGEGRRPPLEIRRDHFSARRRRQSADHRQWDADVRKSAAVEGHAADSQSGEDRSRPTTCVRDSAGRAWSICRSLCSKGGLLITANDTRQFRRDVWLYARRLHRAGAQG